MSDRWIPVLAAVVGLLGGMGGAFIGGYVANEGQERRFDNERDVRREEERRTTYADFLQAAAKVNQGTGGEEQIALTDTARARVDLFADAATREAASAVSDALIEQGPCVAREPRFEPNTEQHQQRVQDCYRKAQVQFVNAARLQLEAGK